MDDELDLNGRVAFLHIMPSDVSGDGDSWRNRKNDGVKRNGGE